MTRWYPLEHADDEFISTAPHVFRYQKRFAATPEQVWATMTSDESMAAWGPPIKKVTWTSPRPFGVGTTREVVVGGSLRERYYLWDEGRRNAFYVYEASLPIFKRFAEDYVVEPVGAETLFTWTVAIEPKDAYRLPVKLLAPVVKAALARIPSIGQRYFAKHG
jgi:hypothetical protein